jgi:hypothetical protein
MTLVVSLTIDDVYKKYGDMLTGILPAGVKIIQGWPDRTAMPAPVPGFAVMSINLLTQLRTPVETWDRNSLNPNALSLEQGTKVRIQTDFYGALAGNWAIILATIMRNEYACTALAPMAPLYCAEPKQAPLITAEAQYESRWIVDAHLQYNPVVTASMQFADDLAATLINVDERYPPS